MLQQRNTVIINGVLYVPAEEIIYAPKGVRYIKANSASIEQYELAKNSDLHNHGDMKLVWVNECDLYMWNEST